MLKILTIHGDKLVKLGIVSLVFLWPFLFLKISINDDAYVYFNYAKNFARGNFFAYDSRGTPSEGFTSLVYLFSLVPFEFFRFPMPLAAFLINVFSVFGTSWFSSEIFRVLFPEKSNSAWLFGLLIFTYFLLDPNLSTLVGWGLETILNTFCFSFLIFRALVAFKSKQTKDFSILLFAYAICNLIRPENWLIGLPWVLFLLGSFPKKRSLLLPCLFFVFSVVSFLSWKLWFFGDLLPTGFYRKASGQRWTLSYFHHYAKEYALIFHFFYWVIIFGLVKHFSLLRNHLLIKKAAICSLLSFFCLIIFVSKVNPIQGYFHRYLTLGTFLIYLGGSSIFMGVMNWSKRLQYPFVFFILMALFAGGHQKQRKFPWSLFNETIDQIESDPYLSLGSFLQNHVSKPEEITLMFGDAGSIPYAFDCKFVDINGLTEPYLAKMFRASDRRGKVTDYILRNKIDLAVIAVEAPWMNLSIDSQKTPQGPLSKPNEYAYLLRKMKKEGFVYAGSIHSPAYDVHFGLNTKSPRFKDLQNALFEYRRTGKAFLKGSELKVEFSDGDIVFNTFDGINIERII